MVRPINLFKKICVLGDMMVGKTSIVDRYVKDEFNDEYIPSIGTKVSKKNVEIPDPSGITQGMSVNLMIWDLLGSREHAALHKVYYAGAEGGILVCDATRENTVRELAFWVKNFRLVVQQDTPLIIAINKMDEVNEPKRPAKIELIRDVCKELKVAHMEVSACTAENIDTLFYTIAENMIETRPF